MEEDAVKAFRRVAATDEQKQWLRRQGVDTDRPATEQTGRLVAILVRAEVEVVKAMRSKTAQDNLSASDRVFLETEDLHPDTPGTDQADVIKELVKKLEKEEEDALARQHGYTQVCSLCTVCVADVTWHLLHAGKHGAGRS